MNKNAITLEDCVNNMVKDHKATVISNGKVIGFIQESCIDIVEKWELARRKI